MRGSRWKGVEDSHQRNADLAVAGKAPAAAGLEVEGTGAAEAQGHWGRDPHDQGRPCCRSCSVA